MKKKLFFPGFGQGFQNALVQAGHDDIPLRVCFKANMVPFVVKLWHRRTLGGTDSDGKDMQAD